MRLLFTSIIAFSICIATPFTLRAQMISPDIAITLIPENPKPGQQVTAQAESFGTSLSESTITWTYDGKTLAKGVGETVVTFFAPTTSIATTLSVTAVGATGTAQTSVRIWPASLDLIWEAVDAYTPPFYKGKALLPINGTAKVVAIPHSSAPKNITYKWEHNDQALSLQSGTNKNALTFTADPLDSTDTVTVSAQGGTFSSRTTVQIPTRTPSVIAYKKTEGFIDFSKGFFNTIVLPSNGARIFFAPFNFSIPNTISKDLLITITSGTEDITDPARANEVVLSSSSNGSTLRVVFQTIGRSLQQITKSFGITSE